MKKMQFVWPSDVASEFELPQNLRNAFATATASNLEPEWIRESDCLQLKHRVSVTVVCEPFSGCAFEHLKQLEFRIFGPQCVIYCIQKADRLPKVPYPVFTATMKGIVVCCTNIEKQTRESLFSKIKLMGGEVTGNLTNSVTHLVAGEVGSKKYHVACKLGKPVMLPEWVFSSWEKGLDTFIRASDPAFDQYRCPVLKGLQISVSQLDVAERALIQKLVVENGGKYSGELNLKETTHLILLKPDGQKYRYALRWKVRCVTVNWLYDSVQKGVCMDDALYQLAGSSITPTSDSSHRSEPLSDSSFAANVSVFSRINETMRSDDFSHLSQSVSARGKTSTHPLDAIEMSAVHKAGTFLDGCKLFCIGFAGNHAENLRRIINSGGGTRLSHLCDAVSHVIVNGPLGDHVSILEDKQLRPHVLSVDWLIESINIERLADEKEYQVWKPKPIEIPSPVVNKNTPNIPVTKLSTSSTEISSNTNGMPSAFDDVLMNLYMEEPQDARHEPETSDSADDIGTHTSEETTDSDPNGLFAGLTFATKGFSNSVEIEDMITENKGKIVSLALSRDPNYIVVPLIYHLNRDRDEVVTEVWLRSCLEKDERLPVTENELFKPLVVDETLKPLAGCVVSISQYVGVERESVTLLAVTLGAKCEDTFVRRVNTHLICDSPDGSKYAGAVKWRLPAVTKDWLLACARTGKRVEENNFLVGDAPAQKAIEPKDLRNDSTTDKQSDVPTCTTTPLFSSTPVGNKTVIGKVVADNDTMSTVFGEPVGHKRLFTPAARTPKPQMTRIRDMISENRVAHQTLTDSAGIDTPNKFMNPDVKFTAKFDFTDVYQHLDSPSSLSPSTAFLEDLMSDRLTKAANPPELSTYKLQEVTSEAVAESGPLHGVIICVSKKLVTLQGDLNKIVGALGGDCRWTYDNCCTHFVYQGKTGDASRELRHNRSIGKIIVCPDWVYACEESKSRVDENLYPYTYNASMLLHITPARETTKHTKSQKVATPPSSDTSSSDLQANKDESASRQHRETVHRDMEIMLATKTERSEKRKQANTSLRQRGGMNNLGPQSCDHTPKKHFLSANEDMLGGSQDVPSSTYIGWDDPTGRAERKLIEDRLATETQSQCQETQLDQFNACRNSQTDDASSSGSSNKENGKLLPKIMLSGMDIAVRSKYESLISRLGGTVSNSPNFEYSCTHLIVNRPGRTEKFLASLASGKWILHESYLEACRDANRFVDEEPYEWGSDDLAWMYNSLSSQIQKAALSARRWRIKVQATKSKAFCGWQAIVYIDEQKTDALCRLLEAGGAKVVDAEFPFSNPKNATIAFLDLVKARSKEVDLEALVAAGVMCLRLEYIHAFLSDDPLPPTKHYYISEVMPLLGEQNSSSLGESAGKRKAANSVIPMNTRKRQR